LKKFKGEETEKSFVLLFWFVTFFRISLALALPNQCVEALFTLGAFPNGTGTYFSVFAPNAERRRRRR